MTPRVIILSGPVGSGKTTLAQRLSERYGLFHFKSSDHLIEQARERGIPLEREALQGLGEQLDRETEGEWVVEAMRRQMTGNFSDRILVVDAVRIQKQIEVIRNAFGLSVVHVHLTAPSHELARRYQLRGDTKIKESKSYNRVQANATEAAIGDLKHDADAVIDTTENRPDDVVVRVASHLGLYGREYLRLVDVLIGGQYGSEGKGQIAAYLSREYAMLVRVGGPNAGHSVHLGGASTKTFHMLPSGTLSTDAQLVIAPGAVINVEKLLREIGDCDIERDRLAIDPQVMVISASDVQQEEQRLKGAIGSTAQGVGCATARRITGRSGAENVQLARDVAELKPYVRDTCEILERAFKAGNRVLLEGTQGTGLSLYHGQYPYVTSRDTTVAGCLAEAGVSPSRVRKVIMVCRTYPIRVQSPQGSTSGFMSQEISWKVVAERSGLDAKQLKKAEKTSTTKRDRRVSEFDWVLLRKSATLNGPTDIALTFADYLCRDNEHACLFSAPSAQRTGAGPNGMCE